MIRRCAHALLRHAQHVRWFNVKPQIDLKHILQRLPEVAKNVAARNIDLDLSPLAALHEQHVAAVNAANDLRQQRNQVASQMKSKDLSPDDRASLVAQGRQLKAELSTLDEERTELWEKLSEIAVQIPNFTDPTAPDEEQVLPHSLCTTARLRYTGPPAPPRYTHVYYNIVPPAQLPAQLHRALFARRHFLAICLSLACRVTV